ncbi:hypothetical protein R6Z07F_003053 [Ovis aries]
MRAPARRPEGKKRTGAETWVWFRLPQPPPPLLLLLLRMPATAASQTAHYRFSSHRVRLRTEAEAQGRARDIPRAPSRRREDADGLPPPPAPGLWDLKLFGQLMGKSPCSPGAGHQWAWSWLEAGLAIGARLSKLAAGPRLSEHVRRVDESFIWVSD